MIRLEEFGHASIFSSSRIIQICINMGKQTKAIYLLSPSGSDELEFVIFTSRELLQVFQGRPLLRLLWGFR